MATTMINIAARIAFFIASFFPLWAIMLYLLISKYGYDGFLIFAYAATVLVIILCISHVKTSIRDTKRDADNSKQIRIYGKTETTKDYVFSIIPYILVISSANMGMENIVSLVAMFVIIGILYVRTNMVLTNPMLLLIGFRVFEIECFESHNDEKPKKILLLSRYMPWNGRDMDIEEIYDGIYMENREMAHD